MPTVVLFTHVFWLRPLCVTVWQEELGNTLGTMQHDPHDESDTVEAIGAVADTIASLEVSQQRPGVQV